MECTICKSKNDVKHLGSIYTIGSEGTNLCLNCRILTSNMLKKVMSICQSVEIRTIKKKGVYNGKNV